MYWFVFCIRVDLCKKKVIFTYKIIILLFCFRSNSLLPKPKTKMSKDRKLRREVKRLRRDLKKVRTYQSQQKVLICEAMRQIDGKSKELASEITSRWMEVFIGYVREIQQSQSQTQTMVEEQDLNGPSEETERETVIDTPTNGPEENPENAKEEEQEQEQENAGTKRKSAAKKGQMIRFPKKPEEKRDPKELRLLHKRQNNGRMLFWLWFLQKERASQITISKQEIMAEYTTFLELQRSGQIFPNSEIMAIPNFHQFVMKLRLCHEYEKRMIWHSDHKHIDIFLDKIAEDLMSLAQMHRISITRA